MKFILFSRQLFLKIKNDDIIFLSNEVTYKILLSFFPFIIFLMAILGFLNIDGDFFISKLNQMLPQQIMTIINTFNNEVIYLRSPSLLSLSLLMTVVSASSGFRAIMRGVNKANGVIETRSFFQLAAASVLLMLVFTLGIVASLILVILNDAICSLAALEPQKIWLLTKANILITASCLLLVVMTIYHFAGCKKNKFIKNLPGATVTVALWMASSEVFNVYINNFSNYSKVYGSIGGILILILWLNTISMILLIGSEINSFLQIYQEDGI